MKEKFLTDEQVEKEIKELNESEAVKLARLNQRIKYRRRQHLYTLRWLEKQGQKLINDGVTAEDLKKIEAAINEDLEVKGA